LLGILVYLPLLKLKITTEEAVITRGFPVFFLKLKFPNYYLSSGKDKSLNKIKIYDLLRKAP